MSDRTLVAGLFQLVTLGVACLTVWFAWSLTDDLREELAGEIRGMNDEVGVVVAAREIPPGHTLALEDLEIASFLPDFVPDDALVHTEQVVGRVTRERILPRELIRDERLARPETGAGLNAIIPTGMRAIGVDVSGADSVSGFVLPNNRVDVIATLLDDGDVIETVTVLHGVTILAVDDRVQASRERGVRLKPMVTLALTPEEAERITHVVQTGLLRLTLRGDADYAGYARRGTVTEDLLGVD